MTGSSLEPCPPAPGPSSPSDRRDLPSISSTVATTMDPSGAELQRMQHWTSDGGGGGSGSGGPAELEVMVAPPKVAKLGNYSLWCYFITVMPAVVPILILVKDSDITRRIFLGFFIAVLIVILVCFSLVIFQTRTRQMFRAGSSSRRDSSAVAAEESARHAAAQYAEHGLRRSVPPVDRHLLAATHRILASASSNHHHGHHHNHQRHRSAYRAARTEEEADDRSPSPRRLLQSPIHSSHHQHQVALAVSPARAGSSPSSMRGGVPLGVHLSSSSRHHHHHHHDAHDDFVQFFGYHVQLDESGSSFGSPSMLMVAAQTSSRSSVLVTPRDSPPPYHVAINLPVPDPGWDSVPVATSPTAEMCETPPPPYEHTLN